VPLATILGCASEDLGADEAAFFRDADPLGFILFRRNCAEPDRLRRLVGDLRDAVGRTAPILIDQEGGRVARLRPPHWPAFPSAGRLGRLAACDPEAGAAAVRDTAEGIAAMLRALGIDMVAAPVLDLGLPGTDPVIGDRAYGADPERVAALGRVALEAFLAAGVLPVIKHLPGHGRTMVDSHHALPRIDAPRTLLLETDFHPFRALADAPAGMTGHMLLEALDPLWPASLSPTVIGDVVRGEIGFDGLLLSDDLSMAALAGPIGERAASALAAGSDVALHCNGDLAEMCAVAAAAAPLSADGERRLAAARARVAAEPDFADPRALAAAVDARLTRAGMTIQG
jgi:beta-N-acetylhexosaminidase